MIAEFKPCRLYGRIDAPPSKSMAHRYLIGAALSREVCTLTGVDFSEDILASIDCLRALGARVTVVGDRVEVDGREFLRVEPSILECRESGSTLRFFLPLTLCLGKKTVFRGSERLLSRPLGVYEELCRERGFLFEREGGSLTVSGRLESGSYPLRGDVSSQFITGMLFALVYLGGNAEIRILPPFESRSYIDLTLAALRSFGASVAFEGEYCLKVKKAPLHSYSGRIEGDYSNAAFLAAFGCLGSRVEIGNLLPDSLQGDRVYGTFFEKLREGIPTLDISDCPDLGPVLMAVAALHHGAVFTGTDRLRAKESDRGEAMKAELEKLGGEVLIGENRITVIHKPLIYRGEMLSGHNDHRIVMAMSVILSQTGGAIAGAEAIKKSYPGFFADIKKLGAEVELYDR